MWYSTSSKYCTMIYGNICNARQIYQDRCLNQRLPDKRMFPSIYEPLEETGKLAPHNGNSNELVTNDL